MRKKRSCNYQLLFLASLLLVPAAYAVKITFNAGRRIVDPWGNDIYLKNPNIPSPTNAVICVTPNGDLFDLCSGTLFHHSSPGDIEVKPSNDVGKPQTTKVGSGSKSHNTKCGFTVTVTKAKKPYKVKSRKHPSDPRNDGFFITKNGHIVNDRCKVVTTLKPNEYRVGPLEADLQPVDPSLPQPC